MAQDTPSKPALFDFTKEKKKIDELISDWNEEVGVTVTRREVRKKEYNVAEMRTAKLIKPDETYIARRVIDQNIAREKPEFVAYVEQSPRLVHFKPVGKPDVDTISLADWFSVGMKYENWSKTWHRQIDGTRLHGANFIEVRADDSKPYNLSLVFTPREFLIFPAKTRDSIQRCEKVLRKYEYFPNELEDSVKKHGFNSEVVKKLTEKSKETNRVEPICVYKVLCKYSDIVYVFWYSQDCNDKWLKDPEPLMLGHFEPGVNEQGKPTANPLPATQYPYFSCVFEYTEDEIILNCKGRAAKDLADQDALSTLWTATVNGTTRAANLQGSLVNGPNTEGMQSQPIPQNEIFPKQLEFFQAAYPDPMILQVAQALGVENLQAAGKVDYAVTNRKDSRKTATELDLARDQAARLTSTNITPLADCIVETYTFCWQIIQSQVKTTLETGIQLITVPDYIPRELFYLDYTLAAAGDTEVIKRAEKIANLQQDLPLFSNTPVYPSVLAKYIELRFTDEAQAWKAKLESTNLLPISQQLLQVLSSIPQDGLTPEQQQQLNAIMTNAQSAIAAAGVPGGTQPMANGLGNSNTNPQSTAPPQPANAGSRQSSGQY